MKSNNIDSEQLEQNELYGIARLSNKSRVLLCKGRENADAAHLIAGESSACLGWESLKTNFEPLIDYQVIIWPSNNPKDIDEANTIFILLKSLCKSVKIINPNGSDKSWDAYEALESEWNYSKLAQWAKDHVQEDMIEKPAPAMRPPSAFEDSDGNFDGMSDQDFDRFVVKYDLSPTAQAFLQENEGVDYILAPPEGSLESTWERLGLAMGAGNKPFNSAGNIFRVFDGSERIRGFVWYDTFYQKYLTILGGGEIREWGEDDENKILLWLHNSLGLHRVGHEMVRTAVCSYAKNDLRNEPRDWFESLKWDREPRIERCLTDYFGSGDSDYHRAASSNWWKSMVARVYHPGCKVDTMVILEGPQGQYKSTALQVIGDKWYSEIHESVTSKDFYMEIQGKMLVEISEMGSFRQAEITAIKSAISRQVDRFRPPYGRIAQDWKRQCVFCGTTNEGNYLRDDTGARRFWPIKIGTIDLEGLKRDREQMFAEAVHRIKIGECWYEMPVEATSHEQEGRRQEDAWEDIIGNYLASLVADKVTVAEIADDCLKIDASKLDMRAQFRIGRVLRLIGWEKYVGMKNGVKGKMWRKGL